MIHVCTLSKEVIAELLVGNPQGSECKELNCITRVSIRARTHTRARAHAHTHVS